MKKLLNKAGELLLYIVLTPLCILFGIGLLLYLPIDFVCYHCSDFYKDTRHKYELFAGSGHWFRLYNTMRKEDLPLDFHLHVTEDINYGYFRYKNILLVQDYPAEYEPNSKEWFVCYDKDDREACTPLAEALESEVAGFNEIVGQPLCDRAVLLVDRSLIPEDDLPHLDRCPLLLGYNGKKGLVPTLKQWIEKN